MPRGQRTAREDRRYARALSHPTRVRILALLEERVATPRDLAEWLDGPTLGAVSHHVRLLHRVGLIRLVRTTSVRGALSHHYKAAVRVRVAGEGWDDATPIVKHATAASALEIAAHNLRAAASADAEADQSGAQLGRRRLRLDERGWREAAAACERLVKRFAELEEASAARAQDAREAALLLLLFEPFAADPEDLPEP